VDARQYVNPAWRNRLSNNAIPDTLLSRGRTAEQFGVHRLFVLDIFDAVPGEEIVAVFAAQSQRCVRILDLAGTVLFQAWYDGHIESSYWMHEAGLLVLAGDDGSAYMKDRGYPNSKAVYPRVVFAIRPRLGMISTQFITAASGDGALDPVWFRCLIYPFELIDTRLPVLSAHSSPTPGSTVAFSVSVPSIRFPDASLGWVIDSHGNEIINSRSISDEYLNDPSLPDPDAFYLGDLPPINDAQSKSGSDEPAVAWTAHQP
jgi:hypothetical protein